MEYDDAMSKVKTLASILRDKTGHAKQSAKQYGSREYTEGYYSGYADCCEDVIDLLKLAGFDLGEWAITE